MSTYTLYSANLLAFATAIDWSTGDTTLARLVPDDTVVRTDLYRVLDCFAPTQVQQLRLRILAGEIDGDDWGDGRGGTACILGWLGYLAQRCPESYEFYDAEIDSWMQRPLELYVQHVQPGQTPDDCLALAQLVAWIDAWLLVQARLAPLAPWHLTQEEGYADGLLSSGHCRAAGTAAATGTAGPGPGYSG